MKKLPAYRVYLITEFVVAIFFAMIFVASGVYQVTTVGLDPLQLVLVGTTLELSAFLGEVPTGVVADAYSRRLSIIIGYVLIGAGFVVEGSFPFFFAILAGQVLWGIGYTFTSGATQAWISDEIGEERAGRAFIRADQVGNVGAIIGIVLGALIGSMRINYPIVGGGIAVSLIAIFLALTMPEQGFRPTPRENRNSFQHMWHIFTSGLAMTQKRPALISILSIGLIFGLYSEGVDRLWTAHLIQDIHLPAPAGLQPVVMIGAIRIGSLGFSILTSEIARRRVDTSSHSAIARAVMLLNLVMVVSLLLFAWADSFGVAVAAYWVFATMRGTSGPLYTAWVNQKLDSKVRATVISMSSQVDALGQTLGGPVIGVIGSALSIRAALSASALILSPALAVLGRTIRRGDEPPVTDPEDIAVIEAAE